jgi:hypothetical protein
MTMIVVMLIGLGTIFIASALDCSDIQTTFMNIVSGKTIDWTGQSANCSGGLTLGPGGTYYGPGYIPLLPDGTCPKGYSPATAPSGKMVCKQN